MFAPQVLDRRRAAKLQRATERVAPRLCEFFDHAVAHATVLGSSYERLWRVAQEQVQGGKLIRPAMFICALEAYTGRDADDEALELAVSIELLHFSFLLHDDVIDGDLVRRGKPNFIARIAAEGPDTVLEDERLRWARSAAILMGDLLLSAVHRTMTLIDVPDAVRLELARLLEDTITTSVAGELVDVELSNGVARASMETVLETSARKTAAYSFAFPLRAAAILSGAGSRAHHVLSRAASHLGLAFQLQDDLMSVFGDETSHGKDFCSDLREGKVTALIAHARTADEWDEIRSALGRPDLTRADAERIRELLAASGAAARVDSLIEGELRRLEETLDQASGVLPAGVADLVRVTAEVLRGRSA